MNTRSIVPVLLALCPLSAAGQEVLSLDDCIAVAQENSIDIRLQYNAVEMRRVQSETSNSSYVPTVEANITPAFSTGMNMDVFVKGDFLYLPARIEAHMPLLDLGIRNDRKARDYDLKAAEARCRQTRQDVAIAVTSYYLQAQYAKNALALASDMVQLDKENLEYVDGCVADGALPESELARARLALAVDEKNVIAARGMASQALIKLQHFINSDSPLDVVASSDSLPSVPDCNPDVEANAGVTASRYELLGSQSDLEAARSRWYPSVSLGASAGGFTFDTFEDVENLSYDRPFWDNRTAAVWVNVRIPILDRSGARHAVRSQKLRVVQSQMALDRARQEYLRKVRLLEDRIQTGLETAAVLDAVTAEAGSNYAFQQDRYEGGYSTWTELQEAKKQLFEARASRLDNLMQCRMDCRILDIYLNSL